jgi:hypothetical protein
VQQFKIITKLSEDFRKEVEILRVGKLYDRDLEITLDMLNDMVRHFKADVYGQEIPVNLDHFGGEAMGWFRDCRIEGDSLVASIEWTVVGKEKLENKLYKYVSIEFVPTLKAKDGKVYENVVVGLALTNNPAMKDQRPVELKETINLTTRNMEILKVMLEALEGKEVLTQAELDTVSVALEASELEDKTQFTEQLGALQEKLNAQIEAKKAEAKAEKLSEKKEAVKLAEVMKEKQELAQRVELLEKDKRKVELTESLKSVALLSEERPVGLNKEQFDDLVKFALELSDDQVTQLSNILDAIVKVELGELGKGNQKVKLSDNDEEAELESAQAEAEELSQKSGRPLAECLSEVFAQKGLK